jgi:MFS superfamily sulfate permease-like transporter
MTHIREAMGTSFLIGMLGFFESSVAAKSLGSGEVVEGMQLSPNRELIALGTANLIGACFLAIPAFGGYGRSKLNKQTGGMSPMSSIFLAIITVLCILFALPWFYYIPVRLGSGYPRSTPSWLDLHADHAHLLARSRFWLPLLRWWLGP